MVVPGRSDPNSLESCEQSVRIRIRGADRKVEAGYPPRERIHIPTKREVGKIMFKMPFLGGIMLNILETIS